MNNLPHYAAACLAALFLCSAAACNDTGPAPGPEHEPDIEYTATHALSVFYPEANEDGSWNFSVALADVALKGGAEDPLTSGKGKIVVFDLCAFSSALRIFPEGTYPFAEDASVSTPGCIDYGFYQATDGLGVVVEEWEFLEATATISHTDKGYRIELSAQLADGRWLRCDYEGGMTFESGGGNPFFPGLIGDVKTTFNEVEGICYGPTDKEGTLLYIFDLYDADETESAERILLSLVLFSKQPQEFSSFAPLPGIYRVDSTTAPGTLLPGGSTPGGFDLFGSYCELGSSMEDDREYVGLVVDGTVEIARAGTEYTLTAKLRDTDGFAIEGSYTGPLECGNESYYSISKRTWR